MKEFIQQQWTAIENQPFAAGQIRTLGTGIESIGRAVLLGVDSRGCRVLLVPIPISSEIREDRKSRGVQVRLHDETIDDERVRTAVVSCEDRYYWPAFDSLVVTLLTDLSEGERADPSRTIAAIRVALSMQRGRLSREQIIGIWGELQLLLILAEGGKFSLDCWTARHSALKDFTFPKAQIEVKTTASTQPRRVRISGLEQLAVSTDRELYVFANLIEADPSGESIGALMARLVSLGVNPEELYAALELQGANLDAIAEADTERWRLRDQAMWIVGLTFPKILAESFVGGPPPGVVNIGYDVSLDSIWADRIALPELRSLLTTIVR
jgi:hypothetical protein